MARNQSIHYVSVGANTYDAPGNVYSRLLGLIDRSLFRDRFHMLGWVPWAEVAGYYGASHAGINIDAMHYESIYGTRTRLVEMLGAGLPVVTSLGCELSDLLGQYGAGLTFPTGAWTDMGNHILSLAGDKALCERMAERALHYANHELSFYTTTAPVRKWANHPTQAPDNDPIRPKQNQLEYRLRALVRRILWHTTGRDK
jgi:glycosyltransferase involved in cell wall biosynthesis